MLTNDNITLSLLSFWLVLTPTNRFYQLKDSTKHKKNVSLTFKFPLHYDSTSTNTNQSTTTY